MLQKLKARLHDFKHSRPGHRFIKFYEQQKQQRTGVARFLYPLASLVCFAIGVVLAVIPGPAFVFFGLALALLAAQSRWVANLLDRAELATRKLWRSIRRKHART